jgi:hypothetical protein
MEVGQQNIDRAAAIARLRSRPKLFRDLDHEGPLVASRYQKFRSESQKANGSPRVSQPYLGRSEHKSMLIIQFHLKG